MYGPEHPDIASTLTNLSIVQEDLGQRVEAEANVRRALGIYDASLPADHPNTRLARRQLARLVSARGEVLMNIHDDNAHGDGVDDRRPRHDRADASQAERDPCARVRHGQRRRQGGGGSTSPDAGRYIRRSFRYTS